MKIVRAFRFAIKGKVHLLEKYRTGARRQPKSVKEAVQDLMIKKLLFWK